MLPPISYRALIKLLLLALTLMPVPVGRIGTRQNSTRIPAQTAPQQTYLPPGENEVSLLSNVLFHLKEPSLLEAANDERVRSFRVSFFSPVPTHEVAVRLFINPDGSGEITTNIASSSQAEVKRSTNRVQPAEVDRFLQLINKAEFWSTPSVETNDKQDGRKPYVMDGAFWMLEGVQNGEFHYVYRRNPTLTPITEIGCYLAKDLAKADDAPIPMAGCATYHQPNRAGAIGSRQF